MKMGFITAILEDYSFEEVIDFASAHGFSCVELACWPSGKAERRYAGVSHLDVDVLDEAKVHYVQEYCKKRGVEISSLAFYPNTMDPDLEKRAANIEHLKKTDRSKPQTRCRHGDNLHRSGSDEERGREL